MPSDSKSRRRRSGALLCIVLSLAGLAAASAANEPAPPAPPAVTSGPGLVWDTTQKVITAKPGQGTAEFSFTAVNISDHPVKILQLRPTCGCTVAQMPEDPWVLAPGASGTFTGMIDFRGKEGTVEKSIFVNTSSGTQSLELVVHIPTLTDAERAANREIAQRNRQAVFQGSCAACHLTPAIGKSGAELFSAACGVCHFASRRSTIVPDLLVARQHRDADFWRKWISEGKSGTLMPAWARRNGGPLTDEQIETLVTFALQSLPTEPPSPDQVAP